MKITALKACQMRDTGQTLVRVETDAGLLGYGEAGGPGPMTRGFLHYYEDLLLGKDPLEVDKLWQCLMNYQHPNRGHVPTTSGIDIALWDIAGKHYG
ncbi:MAG: mandelate racemase/muconate lactonizing enzyme family protein, partial [Gemmatimonadota bacterium]